VSQQPSKARIIQRAAVPPTPYFPKVGPTIFLTTMAGLALGLGLAFILEVMSAAANAARMQRLPARSHVAAAQLERSIDIPPMIVPAKLAAEFIAQPIVQKPEPDSVRPVANMTASASRGAALEFLADGAGTPSEMPLAIAIAEACQSLKDAKGYKAFSFTSLGSEGPDAALLALSTARALSANKKRVAIIDISQHGGDVEMLAGLPGGVGLTDLVAGTADFTKIISRDPHSTLHLIRKGLSRDQDTAGRIAEKFESVITALNSIYDFVFVHVGEAYAAAPGLVKNCPAAFILSGAARQRDALAAAQILQTNGVLLPMFVQVNAEPVIQNRKAASA
jgi:polysaccharide biosynthesis transport protein